MKSLLAACVAVFALETAAVAQTHPRLFFDAAAIPGYQAKANTAPWSTMLSSIEWNTERDLTGGYDANRPFAQAFAALHLFKGSGAAPADYANQARLAVLWNISAPDASNVTVWANNGYKSLSRAGRQLGTAIAFDLCHSAWTTEVVPASFTTPNGITYNVPATYVGMNLNAAVSLALKLNADSLVASGGSEWPGDTKTANNWFAVRYGSALLGYLACDEAESGWSTNYNTCLSKLRTHLDANLTKRADANGWNPEGIAYAQYPGYFMYPAAFALKRAKNVDLTTEYPAMKKALWATYQGVLPIYRYSRTTAPGDTRNGWAMGVRPDLTDDHNGWDPEGTAALAFAFAPTEYLPGLKWMYRRLVGDLGDNSWDVSTGNGLWSLLFYPDTAVTEQNPTNVWGNIYEDRSYGVYVFRNRFQDANDFVMQTHGNLRQNNGGHYAADGLSFRLYGLGVPWAVGSGRTTDPRGQTNVFPDDPNNVTDSQTRLVPTLIDTFLRANGDGYTVMNMDTTEIGVANQTRRIVTDYSGVSGAPGYFIISDSSNNGTHWRFNTPDFNTITTDNTARTFTITGPDGQKLNGTVLWPQTVTFRTGTFDRPNSFFYKEVGVTPGTNTYLTNNKWVDFAGNGDGKFLVAITVTDAAAAIPTVTSTGTGVVQTITAGARTVSVNNNVINVSGWTKPNVSISTPTHNQQFNNGATNVSVSGTSSDADGMSKVEIYLDGVKSGDAALDTMTGAWSYTLPNVPVGAHTIEARAFDGVNDQNSVTRLFQVNNTQPPLLAFTFPTVATAPQPGQTVVLQGTASDPEGSLNRVEIWINGTKTTTNATISSGNWSYNWTNVPVGQHTLQAIAFDGAGDFTATSPFVITVSQRFANTNFGDGAKWLMANKVFVSSDTQSGSPTVAGTRRWRILEHEGDLRLHCREIQSFDYAAHQLFSQGTNLWANWRMEYKFKSDEDYTLTPDPESFITFGTGLAGGVTLDMRRTNGVAKLNSYTQYNKGTRVWYYGNSGTRPEIAWSLNAHVNGQPGYPNNPASDKAGNPGATPQWNTVKIDRIGRTMKVWVNNQLIMDGNDGWLGTKGPIILANERNTGSSTWYDDVALTQLDDAGNPIAAPDLAPVFTTPAAHANLAVGSTVNLSGTTDPAATSVDVYLGSELIGTAPVTSGAWSLNWTAALGQWSASAIARDANGATSTSSARVFKVTATGGAGGNALPVVTLAQNLAITSPNLGLQGTMSDSDGSVASVQILRNGIFAGNATLGTGTWIFSITNLATGTYTFTARAFDNLGDSSDATLVINHDGNAAPTITNITDRSIVQDTSTGDIAFTIGDDTTAVGSLTLTATSSNEALVSLAGIVFGGSGASRTVNVTPLAAQSGSTTITITVTDGAGKTGSDSFVLTVTAPPVATSVQVSPGGALVKSTESKQFTATLLDQFGAPMVSQPTFAWSVSGGGTISSGGLFTAGAVAGGPFVVSATGGGFTGTANVTVRLGNSVPEDSITGKLYLAGNTAITQPDSDSFGTETYASGDDLVFRNNGIAATNVASATIPATLTPRHVHFAQTSFGIGNAVSNHRIDPPASAATAINATGALKLYGGMTLLNGSGSGSTFTAYNFTALESYNGAGLALLRNGSDARVPRVTVATLADPSPGNTLLCNNIGDNTRRWGSGNVSTGVARIVVTGAKPSIIAPALIAGGIVHPGLQYYPNGNLQGDFMKLVGDNNTGSGDNLVPCDAADYTAGFTPAADEVANISTASVTLTANESARLVRTANSLNLGGFTLTITGGGFLTANATHSNGTMSFAGNPAFIGGYNAAQQITFSAKLSNAIGVTVFGVSQGFNFTNNANDFTGGLFITGGSASCTGTAAGGNDVFIGPLGRFMTGNSTAQVTIGGLSGSGRLSAFFQGANTTTGLLRLNVPDDTYEFRGTVSNGDAGRILSLVKDGIGRQRFTSSATHTGTFAINAGTVEVNGNWGTATGAITLASGATLGGSGTLGGAVSASGVLSPGTTSIGTLSTGSVTWNGTSTNAWRTRLGSSNASDRLAITGDFLKGSGSTFRFDLSNTGTPGTYTLVTWTGATGFLASDFSITNLAPGHVASFEITGSALNLVVTADGVPPAFTQWQNNNTLWGSVPLPQRAPNIDHDFDGFVNLLEYGLGTHPSQNTPGLSGYLNASSRVQFHFDRPTGRDDILTIGECSTDLVNWTSDVNFVETIILDLGNGTERVIIRQSESAPAGTKCFLRVQIVQP